MIPFVLSVAQNNRLEFSILTIQGISVFVLSMCMVVLYDLLLTYNDSVRLFERIRGMEDKKQELTDIVELMKYAAADEERQDLFNQCVVEFGRLIMEFQHNENQSHV